MGIKSALRETQSSVNTLTKSSIASSREQVDANDAVAASYRNVARSAEETSLGNSFGGFSKGAKEAEQETGKFSRGVLAGSGAVSSFGRTLAFASGGFLAFAGLSSTIKDALSGASSVQKSAEVIRSGFGAAGESVVKFGEDAAKLGASASVVDQTSARFAILFKNIGVGPDLAAKMTVGFEQLATSIAAIRGVDPTQFLQNIALAAAGNTRGLRQMGIAVDQTTLKVAAFKLGLTQSVTQALTPAQRAQAIYAVATANLGQFQAQAAKHAGDFTNVQHKLSAEWANAKDVLGSALLPVFTKYGGELANYLQKANASGQLQRNFSNAIREATPIVQTIGTVISSGVKAFNDFAKSVGGAANAIKILAGAWAGVKIAEGVGGIVTSAGRLSTAFKGANTSTLKLGSALGSAGLVAEVGLASFAISSFVLKETGWDKSIRNFGGSIEGLAAKFHILGQSAADLNAPAASTFLQADALAKRLASTGLSKANIFQTVAARFSSLSANDIHVAVVNAVQQATVAAQGPFYESGQKLAHALGAGAASAQGDIANTFTNETAAAAADAANAAKVKAAYNAVIQANAAGIQTMKDQLTNLHQNLKQAVANVSTDLANAVVSAKNNLSSLGQSLASDVSSVLQQPLTNIQNQLQTFQDKRSLENLRRSVLLPGGRQLSTDPAKAIAQLKQLASASSTVSKAAVQDFLGQYQQAVLQVRQDDVQRKSTAATRTISDLTDALSRGKITGKQFNTDILALLKGDGVSYKKAGSLLGSAFENGFRDSVKGILSQAKALAAVPGRAGFTDPTTKIVRPLDTLHKDQEQVVRIQQQIRDKHGALLTRIAKTTEKATAAAQKTAATLGQIQAVNVGNSPTKRNRTRQSHTAALTNGASG